MTSSNEAFQIAAFYHFQSVPADQVDTLAEQLEQMGTGMGLRGLIIFATEGLNGTISAPTQELVNQYLTKASELLGFPELPRKWSEAPTWPFHRFKVRVRPEIVTLGKPDVQPLPPKSATHVSPQEWNRLMEEEDVVVLDTRNWYETRIGKFKGALDPNLTEFNEFSEYLQAGNVPKEKKVLIYCTGGIRCEKAIVEMHNQGFNDVVQLDGGILNYLAQYPNRNFDGECFVFDHRVAVNQELKPSEQYKLCPHCGQPAEDKIQCLRCDTDAIVCATCLEQDPHKHTCSKNCANAHRLAPHKKGRKQTQGYRFASVKSANREAAAQSTSAASGSGSGE